MAQQIVYKYGMDWPLAHYPTPLNIEMRCIQKGWGDPVQHYEAMRKIIWPELDSHRWHNLIMENVVQNRACILAGPASTAKTHEACCTFLMEYWCWPEETCVIMSSTHMAGLRGRAWSEMSSLWQRGIDRFPFLSGHILDTKCSILSDALKESEYDEWEKRARDYRKGIVGVACRSSSGSWIGINRYAGWKQKRMRLIGDELAQMTNEYIRGVISLNSNPDFKFVGCGNFDQPSDCLGRCAEPVDGWSQHMEPRKTSVWKTKYPIPGVCVNLIGLDTPNNDKAKPTDPDPYPYLIRPSAIEEIRRGVGENSIEFMTYCWGCMKIATLSHRVLTREICEAGGAFDDVHWSGQTTSVAFLDSAWGGDRPVFTWAEFGPSVSGLVCLKLHPPEIIPLNAGNGMEVDYMLAEWVVNRCKELGIPPENFGHDSTGRGSLGTAIARVWGNAQAQPIEFGQPPTNRPVSEDHWWKDPRTGERRLKLWNEHCRKFVTELWFAVRYCAEAGQLKNLCEEVFTEFQERIFTVQGDIRDVEPKTGTQQRPGMKQRVGHSPDLADSAAGAVEMARRRGFKISKLSTESSVGPQYNWLRKESAKVRELEYSHQIDYDAVA